MQRQRHSCPVDRYSSANERAKNLPFLGFASEKSIFERQPLAATEAANLEMHIKFKFTHQLKKLQL